MLPFAIASAVLGGIQTISAMNALNNMGPRAEYSIDPTTGEYIKKMEARSKMGLTGDQKAGMYADIVRGENTAFNRSANVGGNQVAGITRAAIGANNGGRYKVGLADAQAQDQHQREYSPWVQYKQGLLDKQTADKQQVFDRQAQAYGQAMQSGLNNITGMFNLNQALNAGRTGAGSPSPAGTTASSMPNPFDPTAVPSRTANGPMGPQPPGPQYNNPYNLPSMNYPALNAPGIPGISQMADNGVPYNPGQIMDWGKIWGN